MHCVYTPVKTIATGGYFYTFSSLHLTELACDVDHRVGEFTTNQFHAGAYCLIINMALTLPNYWDTPMLKIPFLALARLVLKPKDYTPSKSGLGTARYYPQDRQDREELGELAGAKAVVEAVL